MRRVCSYILSTAYVFSAVLYIQTSVCTFHAWMHKVTILAVVVGMYVCSKRERVCSVCALHLSVGMNLSRQDSFRMHMGGGGGGGWKGGGCWALFWRLSGGPWCLRALAWVPHTLFWVNILTSGESHPLPAEHCPTDGAGGGSRQRKETHEEIWGLQRVSQLQSRKQTNM